MRDLQQLKLGTGRLQLLYTGQTVQREGPLYLYLLYDGTHGGIKMERHRGVNLRYTGGADPLCTLHRGEGLYG